MCVFILMLELKKKIINYRVNDKYWGYIIFFDIILIITLNQINYTFIHVVLI